MVGAETDAINSIHIHADKRTARASVGGSSVGLRPVGVGVGSWARVACSLGVWSRHGAGGRLERRAGAAPASMGAARSAPRRRAAARGRVGTRPASGRAGVRSLRGLRGLGAARSGSAHGCEFVEARRPGACRASRGFWRGRRGFWRRGREAWEEERERSRGERKKREQGVALGLEEGRRSRAHAAIRRGRRLPGEGGGRLGFGDVGPSWALGLG
jgi:hypothetical protein